MNTITVEIKNNFGREAIYPACHQSKLFAQLAGTKTMTRDALAVIKQLGYTIEVARPQF
jgi:hypothetical protein